MYQQPRRNPNKSRRTLAYILALVGVAIIVVVAVFAIYINVIQRSGSGPALSASETPTGGGHLMPGAVQPSTTGPYGFSVAAQNVTQQTIDDLKELHVTWLRYQLKWNKIEPEPNQFNWSQLDSVVALANANGIHITFPIQNAPKWAKGPPCIGTHSLPDPTKMAQFASALAQRYNGNNGHGFIDSYEIGNEEYDNIFDGTLQASLPCRQPNLYAPALKAVYPAIKAQSPHALVGMFGLWWVNLPHIQSYMTWLYQNGYGTYFDFANFHYYICKGNPAQTVGNRPSFDLEWQTIHNIMAKYGDSGKPIWVTETGWTISGVDQKAQCAVSPQTQAQYMQYVFQQAAASHVVQHVFWYTIGAKNDGMSITQNGSPLPSFYTMQSIIRDQPDWN
jgi:GH35 family endo-1,4-beta-xylanase